MTTITTTENTEIVAMHDHHFYGVPYAVWLDAVLADAEQDLQDMKDDREYDEMCEERAQEPLVNAIRGGKLVEVRWNDLTPDEQRAAYCTMFDIYE